MKSEEEEIANTPIWSTFKLTVQLDSFEIKLLTMFDWSFPGVKDEDLPNDFNPEWQSLVNKGVIGYHLLKSIITETGVQILNQLKSK